MTPQRPYMAHELDVHPDRLRIESTIAVAVESERKNNRKELVKAQSVIESLRNALKYADTQ